jgi:cellulose synthase/poly-beta-1,6-N-acetylglucosamine synthase-like glycosyltransferase
MNFKVSVVICCYTFERLGDLLEAVRSVQPQSYKPHEIIVAVDHNVELFDRLPSELAPGVKIVLNKGVPGSSETRNVGIRNSSGDIVACMDDDVVAEVNCVKELIQPFEDARVLAVGGQAVPLWPKGKQPFWFPEEFDFIVGCTGHKKMILQANREIRNVTGSNMAFRREIFQKIGYLDENLGRCNAIGVKFDAIGGEEAEICLRIKSNMPDGIILFRPESIVHHKVTPRRATLKYVFNYCFREGITRAMIKSHVSQYGNKPLAAEGLFLRRLMFVSIPLRIKRLYKLENPAQIGVIATNLCFMGMGYLIGRLQYR